MKVLLIQPINYSSKWDGAVPVVPIGLSFISQSLAAQRINHRLVDLCFEKAEDVEGILKKQIESFWPDFVGYTVRNVDNTLMFMPVFFLEKIKAVVEKTKKYLPPHCRQICGGAGFSIMPERILNYLNIDYGVIGEGEKTFIALIKILSGGGDVSALKGIAYRRNGQVFINSGKKFIKNLILRKNLKEIFDPRYFQTQSTEMGLIRSANSLQTKRGCAFQCSYCVYPQIEGRRVRNFSTTSLAKAVARMDERTAGDNFEIVDSVFNYPINASVEFCRQIIRRKIKRKWTACFRPVGLSERYINLIRQAGCVKVEIGVDAVENSLLRVLRKPFTSRDLAQSFFQLNKSKMPYLTYIIFGSPTDDDDKIEYTLKYLDSFNVPEALFFFGIRIYPDTEIYQTALRDGMVKNDEDLLYPKFYFSSGITKRSVPMIKEYAQKHPGWRLIALDKFEERMCCGQLKSVFC